LLFWSLASPAFDSSVDSYDMSHIGLLASAMGSIESPTS
jgi:hypothetical protein